MWRRVAWQKFSDVSEELSYSIFRVEDSAKLAKMQ
jgi:hypothetical protein